MDTLRKSTKNIFQDSGCSHLDLSGPSPRQLEALLLGSRNSSHIPCRSTRLRSSSKYTHRIRAPLSMLLNSYRGLIRGRQSVRTVILPTHLNIVSIYGITGAISPLSHMPTWSTSTQKQMHLFCPCLYRALLSYSLYCSDWCTEYQKEFNTIVLVSTLCFKTLQILI
jgi:hypothetical protein